jgi:very-short-patch-repair endonuclease
VKFFRQYSVGVYIVDFYSPLLKLAIEIDGGQHAEKENKKYDEMRSAYLKGQGIEVMRFWNNEVMQNIEEVLYKIAERLTPPNLPFKKGEG